MRVGWDLMKVSYVMVLALIFYFCAMVGFKHNGLENRSMKEKEITAARDLNEPINKRFAELEELIKQVETRVKIIESNLQELNSINKNKGQ